MSLTQDTVIQAAQRISRLWRESNWVELTECLSEDIIQVGPRLKELSRGRAAAVASYQAFMTNARLLDYHQANNRAEVWPGFATAVYKWNMRYLTDGERRYSCGSDQFIFRESKGRLLAVWRYVDFWEDKADQ